MPSSNPVPSITQNKHLEFLLLVVLIFCLFPGFLQTVVLLPLRLLFPANPPSPTPLIPSPIPIPYAQPPQPYISPTSLLPPTTNTAMSTWFQKTLHLPTQSRGSYLITDTVVSQLPELKAYKVGILHLFVQHTSCALSMNENWDEDVRADMSDAMDRMVPTDRKGNLYRHSAEGADDMPAHIKSALIGSSVTIPITNGKLATGTWQGIWYLEFRTSKHSRKVVATIQGEKSS